MTQPQPCQLAQVNIASMKAPLDDPLMATFVAQLDAVNARADASPGFVWRLKSDDGYVSGEQVFDDPMIIVNMSVWTSIEALERFTYGDRQHLQVLKARRQWFHPKEAAFALWWIPAGHLPTMEEAHEKLKRLSEQGPTAQAFTFKTRFPAPQIQAMLT